jgi:hypothetical protein
MKIIKLRLHGDIITPNEIEQEYNLGSLAALLSIESSGFNERTWCWASGDISRLCSWSKSLTNLDWKDFPIQGADL